MEDWYPSDRLTFFLIVLMVSGFYLFVYQYPSEILKSKVGCLAKGFYVCSMIGFSPALGLFFGINCIWILILTVILGGLFLWSLKNLLLGRWRYTRLGFKHYLMIILTIGFLYAVHKDYIRTNFYTMEFGITGKFKLYSISQPARTLSYNLTELEDIVKNPSKYLGKNVTVMGKIVSENFGTIWKLKDDKGFWIRIIPEPNREYVNGGKYLVVGTVKKIQEKNIWGESKEYLVLEIKKAELIERPQETT